MKIAIASDLSGFPLKEAILKHLKEKNHEVTDFGIPSETEPQPYFIQAPKVARALQQGEAERGILICGTGQGMAIVANKFKGIRAAVCHDNFSAERSVLSNNANVLCMGERVIGHELAKKIAGEWITLEFKDGSSTPKVQEIMDIEKITMK